MPSINWRVLRHEGREQIALLDAMDLRHRPARRLDNFTASGTHPQEPVEESLPLQDLSRSGLQHVAFLAGNLLEPLVAHLVEPHRFRRQHEWVHVSEITEVLVGQSQSRELQDWRTLVEFRPSTIARECHIAEFFVASDWPSARDFEESEALRVGVLVSLIDQSATSLGDVSHEVCGHLRDGFRRHDRDDRCQYDG